MNLDYFFFPPLSSFSSVTLKHTHTNKPTKRDSVIVNLTHQHIQIDAGGLWIDGLVLMAYGLVAEIRVCGSTEMDRWSNGGDQCSVLERERERERRLI